MRQSYQKNKRTLNAKKYSLLRVKKFSHHIFFTTTAVLFLSGCTLAPKYHQPELPVPTTVEYSQAKGFQGEGHTYQETSGATIRNTGWKEFFKDKQLQKVIEIALKDNRDLRLALLKVEEMRAQYGVARASLVPSLSTDASGTYSEKQSMPLEKSFNAQAVSSSYELDLFGKLRSQSESAFETYLSTEEARKASQILIISQAASAYLNERLAKELLNLAIETAKSRKSSLSFIEQRVQSGQSNLLELEQARSLVESSSASVAEAKRTHALAKNALKLMIGNYTLPQGIPSLSLAKQSFTALPAYISSTVLLKRPDIMEAEYALKASHADIGAARAAFFPSITLTGQAGYANSELDFLFAGANTLWSFVPKISLPIFSGGKNRSNLQLAEVRKEESVATYEKAIQTAFKEVADALAARPLLAEQVAAQKRYLSSQRTVLNLAENRYTGGAVSYLEVLDAQRGVFQAEQSLLSLRRDQLLNDINLYIALGGGLKE